MVHGYILSLDCEEIGDEIKALAYLRIVTGIDLYRVNLARVRNDVTTVYNVRYIILYSYRGKGVDNDRVLSYPLCFILCYIFFYVKIYF